MNCDGSMRTTKSHGYHYLKCARRATATEACIGSFVSVRALAEAILRELGKLSAKYLDLSELAAHVALCDTIGDTISKKQEEVRALERRVDEHVGFLKDLYLDKARGILAEDDFLTLSAELSSDKEQAARMLLEAKKSLASLERKTHASHDRCKLIAGYVEVETLTRDHIDVLIDRVFIGKRDQETREIPIEIHWSF